MSYNFDLAAAVNAIATIEDAIATPAPGIVTSYGWGLNPIEFTASSQLPAIVHIPTGPVVADNSEFSHGLFSVSYEVISRVLIVEAVEDQYPTAEAGAALFWKTIMEAMLSHSTRVTLCNASGALSYTCNFAQRSFGIRPWPAVESAPSQFWSLEYTNRFVVAGG